MGNITIKEYIKKSKNEASVSWENKSGAFLNLIV